MENIFGGLLEFQTSSDFEEYLNSIQKEDALKLIEVAIMYGQKHGIYSLTESHCLYLCVKKIKEYERKE